eukprot:2630947-Amphidinium_carterae.1
MPKANSGAHFSLVGAGLNLNLSFAHRPIPGCSGLFWRWISSWHSSAVPKNEGIAKVGVGLACMILKQIDPLYRHTSVQVTARSTSTAVTLRLLFWSDVNDRSGPEKPDMANC